MTSTTNTPRVSVIMPVYNAEGTIAEAIRSVLDQSFRDFELLIVNDGTPDSSMAVCATFSDDRIRIINQENRGLAGARNTGIRAACGDFIALIDSDDSWTHDKLMMHIIHLEASPHVGVSYAGSVFIDEASEPIGLLQTPAKGEASAERIFMRNPIGNGSAPVFRAEAFADIAFSDPTHGDMAFFDESFRQSEDIECWMRIALQTEWKFESISGSYTNYRLNSNGLSANVMSQLEQWERMASKVEASNPDFHRRWVGLARAYQLRYLARRAIHSNDLREAGSLFWKALKAAPRILLVDPRKTLTTMAALMFLRIAPDAIRKPVHARIFGTRSQPC